jgi:carboxylesterase type B
LFDGDDLVREAGGGVVAVLIQYRLGVLGFLPGKQVGDGGALNAGLRELRIPSFCKLITDFSR